MKRFKYPTILTIAGSDSGGGAGIQADLKTIAAIGCFGTSAITAVTVQNTMGITGSHNIPIQIVQDQIRAVMDDMSPSAIKIGLVSSAELALAIADTLKDYKGVPMIFDPVMVATTGERLAAADIIPVLKTVFFPLMTLITPNLDEAEVLTGRKISNVAEMRHSARELLQMGCSAVLLKGGHLKGTKVYDIFVSKQGDDLVFESEFLKSDNLHGTGCTLSSAIASYLSLNEDLPEAIAKARIFVQQAIVNGTEVKTGNGNGPLNHFFGPKKTELIEISAIRP